MYVQMPPGRALLVCRLVRICAACLEHQPHKATRSSTRLSKQPRCLRTFSVGQNHWNDNEEANSDSPPLGPGTTTRLGRLPSRRRQPLSPLERVSRLLPQGSLSPEVTQLREQTQQEPEPDLDVQKGDAAVDSSAAPRHSHLSGHPDSFDTAAQTNGLESHGNGTLPHPEERAPATLPGSTLLKFGELLVAEYRKKRQVEFRKMFQLQEGARLHSNWGTVLHNDVAGQPSGRFLKTTLGMPILMRRASLEDYVLYMKRGPAIAYPKDVSAMLMMMDVTEGDCVLESGSGSGAMSLFLSRAVGSKGRVLSVEIREDHHIRAVQNYDRWRASWGIRREEEWPNNVQFHKADLSKASSLLSGWGFHSVALDILNPHLVLPTVIPHLHPGAVCAVYLAKFHCIDRRKPTNPDSVTLIQYNTDH
ncbi:tRNA (adenine(58)-N(1))-methyltransferase, mitochondrial isoform X2 [Lampris incognitus]|uniref:tRNA (adenine(58)-N(1))-methyltransferase, mitochondrial isoform X2 n=1 Tax=Lampris incognitus TaxID=2546036 RepID=UPI0024B530A5|nr:tRNA (adenine(58)-N(1))-methyltransferase, mitochondrial isoform X2 [Lampris incognitus]